MRAGRLRHLVSLQRASTVTNEFGEQSSIWADYAEVHAAIEPLRGGERIAADQTQSKLTHKVTVRYTSTIECDHRIKYGTRYLYINAIIDVAERHTDLELMCTENAGV